MRIGLQSLVKQSSVLQLQDLLRKCWLYLYKNRLAMRKTGARHTGRHWPGCAGCCLSGYGISAGLMTVSKRPLVSKVGLCQPQTSKNFLLICKRSLVGQVRGFIPYGLSTVLSALGLKQILSCYFNFFLYQYLELLLSEMDKASQKRCRNIKNTVL